MKIRDNETGEIFEYGTNIHHALRISKNGGCLTFENLQNGDGSLKSGDGGYSFVLNDGKTPEESSSPDSMYGATYANIGGFHEHLSRENGREITRSSRDNCGECSRRKWYLKGYEDGKGAGIIDKILLEMQEVKELALLSTKESDCFGESCDGDCLLCAFDKCIEIVRKHENDGWISAEERLPIPNKEVWVTVKRNGNVFTSTDIMTERGYFLNYENGNILAWKEKETIPEPYRPERSNDEKK